MSKKRVLCINDKFNEQNKKYIENFPILGEKYTVVEERTYNHGRGYILKECRNPMVVIGEMYVEPTFNKNRFIDCEDLKDSENKEETISELDECIH